MNIKDVLGLYNIGEIQDVEKVSFGFSNLNYKLHASDKTYLYRVYDSKGKDVAYEISVLKVLKDLKFPASYPIQRRDGKFFTNTTDGIVVIYEFMDGSSTEINEQVIREVARALSKLHKIKYKSKGIGYRANSIGLERCQNLIRQFDDAPVQYPEIFEYFVENTNFFRMPLQIPLPKGLIHGDLFPQNTLFKGGELKAILDFQEVCIDSFLFDIGMTINGFCFEGKLFNENLTAIFLEEYAKNRMITDQEVKLLPVFISWAAHGIIAWHLENDLLNKENPKQLEKVEELMARVKSLRNSKLLISRI